MMNVISYMERHFLKQRKGDKAKKPSDQRPSDLPGTIAFLASDDSDFIRG